MRSAGGLPERAPSGWEDLSPVMRGDCSSGAGHWRLLEKSSPPKARVHSLWWNVQRPQQRDSPKVALLLGMVSLPLPWKVLRPVDERVGQRETRVEAEESWVRFHLDQQSARWQPKEHPTEIIRDACIR